MKSIVFGRGGYPKTLTNVYSCAARVSVLLLWATIQTVAAPGWMLTGSMMQPRRDHTATLLQDGTVLVVGWSQTAELFQPTNGVFTYTSPPLFEHIQGSTATRLANGKVLVVGGLSSLESPAELYDPASGSFSATGRLNVYRTFHTATLLSDGRVLLAGGNSQAAQDSAELYDPATGAFSPVGNLNAGRGGATAALLPNGQVLICGGSFDQPPFFLDSAELYSPGTGTFTFTGNMSVPRASLWWTAAPVLANGKVLIAGGGNTDSASADLFSPASGTFAPTGRMNSARTAPTASLLNDGQVLLAGGASGSVANSTAELYDPASGRFVMSSNLNVPRLQHTATLLLDGRVLVTGGYNPTDGELRSAEVYVYENAPRILDCGIRANAFGFNISWGTNSYVVIEATTTPSDPAWTPISTNVLAGGTFQFSDPNWSNYPTRFYRLRWP